MLDVWVMSAYNPLEEKSAIGAWYAPGVGMCGLTKRVKASDDKDASRIGWALATLSAVKQLGAELRIHVPKQPHLRWVSDPTRKPPFPNQIYRYMYCREIYPLIRSGEVVFEVDNDTTYDKELALLITCGEVPTTCTV